MNAQFKDNYPELFTPESLKRKGEIILDLLINCKKLQEHTIQCVLVDENSHNCDICNNVSAFANATLYREMKNEKMDIKKLIEDLEKIL